MNIEFQTPYNKVSEKLVIYIRNKILELSHISSISRAEAELRIDENAATTGGKVCNIRLTVYGDNLVAHARSVNFDKAAQHALKKLKRLVEQQSKEKKEVPDEVTSTVRV